MMSINKKKHYATGFTLIELLIAVTILGMLIALSVPSFENFIQKRRVQSASETMFTFAKLARSEAIKQNRAVVFYFDTDNACYAMDDDFDQTIGTDCDCDNLAKCTLDGDQKWKKLNDNSDFKDVIITLQSAGSGVDPLELTFTSDGMVKSLTKSDLIFASAGRTYNLEINAVGRIKLKQE